MRLSMAFLTAILFGLQFCNQAKADFVLSIERVQASELVNQNSSVSFDIKLQLPTGTPNQRLTGFSVFMDIASPLGKGLPTGLGPISVSNFFPGFTSSTGSSVDSSLATALSSANFDFSVNAENAAGPDITTAPQTLFRLTIDAGTAPTGSYSLNFVNDPIGEGSSLRSNFPPFTGGAFGAPVGSGVGTFTVTVVPEPSSLCLLGVSLAVYRFRRLRNR